MTTVVNIPALASRFQALGWTTLSVSEIVSGLGAAGIPAVELIAYLDALIANPGGMNDQTITGCDQAVAAKITAYLVKHATVTS